MFGKAFTKMKLHNISPGMYLKRNERKSQNLTYNLRKYFTSICAFTFYHEGMIYLFVPCNPNMRKIVTNFKRWFT